MKHQFSVSVGPRAFRIGSDWRAPIAQLEALYQNYPRAVDRIPDFTVRLEARTPWRRWLRPSVEIRGDFMLPDALPVALEHGLLAAEMAMNLQLALGEREFLLLHAASVARGDRALILTGESGSGKSTLSAQLGDAGWRFMGDEFALIDPATGFARPFPRPVSLKNVAAEQFSQTAAADRLGPWLRATPKGDIRHLAPPADAIAAMAVPARPALIVFPRFGNPRAIRAIGASEVFVRLTQASTNFVTLGERGFAALTKLVTTTPAVAIDYPDSATGQALIDELWDALP